MSVGVLAGRIVAGDFNGDGLLDLAIGGMAITVLPGNGDGTFAKPIAASSASVGAQFYAANLNNDGITDLITTNGSLLASASGLFGDLIPWETPPSIVSFQVGDLRGQGDSDIFAQLSEHLRYDSLYIYLSNGNGTFTKQAQPYPLSADDKTSFVLGDFDSDGKLDVFLSKTSNYQPDWADYSIYLGDNSGLFDLSIHPLLVESSSFYTGFYNAFTFALVGDKPSVLADNNAGNPLYTGVAQGYLAETWDGSKVDITALDAELSNVTIPGDGQHQLRMKYSGTDFVAPSVATASGGDISWNHDQFSFLLNPGDAHSERLYVTNDSLNSVTFNPSLQGSTAFSLTKTCTMASVAGLCIFEITYHPAQAGTDTATLTLNPGNGPAGENPVIALRGRSVPIGVVVGRTTLPLSTAVNQQISGRIYISNYGKETLNLLPALLGDSSFSLLYDPAFQATNKCKAIEPLHSCGIDVVFAPTKAGTFSTRLSFNFVNATGSTPPSAGATITGTATFPAVFFSDYSPQLNTSIDQPPVSRAITRTNTTGVAVSLDPTPLISPFDLTKTCQSIPPHGSCDLTISYAQVGPYFSADNTVLLLNFANPPAGTFPDISVKGFAAEKADLNVYLYRLDLSADLGTFQTGVVPIESRSAVPLHPHYKITGDSAFSVSESCPVIAPFAPCQVEITFTPTKLGKVTGSLNVSYDEDPNPSPPSPIPLYGTGNPPR